jgi:hypothetical protein
MTSIQSLETYDELSQLITALESVEKIDIKVILMLKHAYLIGFKDGIMSTKGEVK